MKEDAKKGAAPKVEEGSKWPLIVGELIFLLGLIALGLYQYFGK